MGRKHKEILGYNVDLLSFNEAIDFIINKSQKESTQTITINPEMIAYADQNEEFAKILKTADLVIPDGFGIQLALRIYGIKQERIPGIEFARKIIEYCASQSMPIALIGAKKETLAKACKKLKEDIPNLNIVYAKDGYFEDTEERQIIEQIKEVKPKLILAALGVPKQELFIRKYMKEFEKTIFIGVGGSFDVWSGEVKRAPIMFRKMGLEWFWRLINAPARFRRMFPTLPIFLFKVIINRK